MPQHCRNDSPLSLTTLQNYVHLRHSIRRFRFHVNIGSGEIKNPGDFCDVLVAMNPAALKEMQSGQNRQHIIIDSDTFDEKGILKAGFGTMVLSKSGVLTTDTW